MMSLSSFVRRYPGMLFHFFIASVICSFWAIYSYKSVTDLRSFLQLASYAGVYVAVTSINAKYLFENLFLKGRIPAYIVSTVLLFAAGSLVLQGIYAHSAKEYLHSLATPAFYIEAATLIILLITFSGLGVAFSLLKLWIANKEKIAELAQINLKNELDNLKSQVSPHFLFNTLNNLYVLAKVKPDLVPDSILQLSNLIKYQLYECNQDRVPLRRELDYIRNLLALEQLRKDQWVINIDVDDKIPETQHIEPFLIIILVENAVKHGMQKLQAGTMNVTVRLQNASLIFNITNSKPFGLRADPANKSIGLNNLTRRLQLLYPDRHRTIFEDKGSEYCATIIIEL